VASIHTDHEEVIVMCLCIVCVSIPVPTLSNVSTGQCDWQLNKHFVFVYVQVCLCVFPRELLPGKNFPEEVRHTHVSACYMYRKIKNQGFTKTRYESKVFLMRYPMV